MDVLQFIKNNFKLHPFLIEALNLEGMKNFHAWGEIGSSFDLLEDVIRQRPFYYSLFSTYYKGEIKDFRIKWSDKLLLQKIEKQIIEKGSDFFVLPKPRGKQNYWKTKYPLLKLLVEHCESGSQKYDPDLKRLGLYLYIKCGPSAYSFLYEHLPLPRKQTVKNELGSIENIVEGELRVTRLLQHLKDHNLPNIIWLSEDATRCVSKVRV